MFANHEAYVSCSPWGQNIPLAQGEGDIAWGGGQSDLTHSPLGWASLPVLAVWYSTLGLQLSLSMDVVVISSSGQLGPTALASHTGQGLAENPGGVLQD